MLSSKPIPFNHDQVAQYEHRRYRGFDQRLVHWRETKILENWLRNLAQEKAAFFLDAPCGYGRFSRLILKYGYRLVSGDLSLAMVERARVLEYGNSKPLGIVINMLEPLPFKDLSFEVVLSLRFFHHLHSPNERKSVLMEIARVTRRWAIVSFYRKQPLHELQRKLRRLVRRSSTRISMVPLATFKEEAAAAGFHLKTIIPLFRGLHAQHFALLEKSYKSMKENGCF